MKRQRHSPPQRHSSLPPSLHRLLVSAPPQQPQGDDDDADDTALQRGDDGEEIAFGGAADPVNPAPGAEPALPSLVLTQAAFAGLGVVEPIASRRHSRSPAPHAAQVAVAPIPALPLPGPSFPPPRTLRTDPVYYASTSSLPPTHPTSPPGPQLRPISWSPESPPLRALPTARLDSPDRSVPPLPRMRPQRSPMSGAATPPSHPVAGPSRLPEEPMPRGRQRRAKGKRVAPTRRPSQETASAEAHAYGAHRRQNPASIERGE
ncbi:hypothetical protein TRAPUB_8166 [Trametes pubescens]|uniref:Uncharacterized protein n=1 Tax=Trametes pubescens TaxID=154538 RepID=A0A1M2W5U7_TRAPU|nr:hypothetical protein TRAPUB_8166 [Trametes pubescens]